MVATSPGHHYGTRSKDSQEKASQSPRKSGATAPKGGKRKPTLSARSSGAFSKRPPPVKPTAAPPGDSVAEDDDDVVVMDEDPADKKKYQLQLWRVDQNGKKITGTCSLPRAAHPRLPRAAHPRSRRTARRFLCPPLSARRGPASHAHDSSSHSQDPIETSPSTA